MRRLCPRADGGRMGDAIIDEEDIKKKKKKKLGGEGGLLPRGI